MMIMAYRGASLGTKPTKEAMYTPGMYPPLGDSFSAVPVFPAILYPLIWAVLPPPSETTFSIMVRISSATSGVITVRTTSVFPSFSTWPSGLVTFFTI